jgi:hypothetical protein
VKEIKGNKGQQLDTLRQHTTNMIMEVAFRTNQHTEACNRLGMGSTRLTKFTVEAQYGPINFPAEGNISGFTDAA